MSPDRVNLIVFYRRCSAGLPITGLGPFIQRPRCGAAFTRQGYGLTDSRRPGAIAGTSGINIATDVSAARLAQARLDRFALASRAWRLALERYRTRSRFKCCKHQSQHHDWNRQALALRDSNSALGIGDYTRFGFEPG